jgi:hypothetical protein
MRGRVSDKRVEFALGSSRHMPINGAASRRS